MQGNHSAYTSSRYRMILRLKQSSQATSMTRSCTGCRSLEMTVRSSGPWSLNTGPSFDLFQSLNKSPIFLAQNFQLNP